MSDFERYAIGRLLDQAAAAGVDTNGMSTSSMCRPSGSYASRKWADEHPDADPFCGCWGAVLNGPEGCTCWVPIYDVEQAEPRPPTSPDDLAARPAMCDDCAFRPDSPERADEWSAEALYASAAQGKPFWCHDGMRRPGRWEHPDGMVVEGGTDDWQPPIVRGIPYRADGSPGLLCAGWTAVAAARRPDDAEANP